MSAKSQQPKFTADVALQRLIFGVGVGCVVILIHGVRFGFGAATNFFNFVSVALLTGGAALLAGGLLGFLFGVPHTREGSSGQTDQKSGETASDQQQKTDSPSSGYR